jgi:hypothetical protein
MDDNPIAMHTCLSPYSSVWQLCVAISTPASRSSMKFVAMKNVGDPLQLWGATSIVWEEERVHETSN